MGHFYPNSRVRWIFISNYPAVLLFERLSRERDRPRIIDRYPVLVGLVHAAARDCSMVTSAIVVEQSRKSRIALCLLDNSGTYQPREPKDNKATNNQHGPMLSQGNEVHPVTQVTAA